VSEPEVEAAAPSFAANYLKLIEQQVREAERELEEGELLRVVVSTPAGRVQAFQLEGAEPALLVVHGVRDGQRTTLITAIDAAQVQIERVPLPPEATPRYIGFRAEN
jgi:hypothetical protein